MYPHTCILNSLNCKLCATFLSGDNIDQLGLRYLVVGFRLCVFRGYLVKLDIEASLPNVCINFGIIPNVVFLVLSFYTVILYDTKRRESVLQCSKYMYIMITIPENTNAFLQEVQNVNIKLDQIIQLCPTTIITCLLLNTLCLFLSATLIVFWIA